MGSERRRVTVKGADGRTGCCAAGAAGCAAVNRGLRGGEAIPLPPLQLPQCCSHTAFGTHQYNSLLCTVRTTLGHWYTRLPSSPPANVHRERSFSFLCSPTPRAPDIQTSVDRTNLHGFAS